MADDPLHPVKTAIVDVLRRSPSELTIGEITNQVMVSWRVTSGDRHDARSMFTFWQVHDALRSLRSEGCIDWITVEDDPEVVTPEMLVRWA